MNHVGLVKYNAPIYYPKIVKRGFLFNKAIGDVWKAQKEKKIVYDQKNNDDILHPNSKPVLPFINTSVSSLSNEERSHLKRIASEENLAHFENDTLSNLPIHQLKSTNVYDIYEISKDFTFHEDLYSTSYIADPNISDCNSFSNFANTCDSPASCHHSPDSSSRHTPGSSSSMEYSLPSFISGYQSFRDENIVIGLLTDSSFLHTSSPLDVNYYSHVEPRNCYDIPLSDNSIPQDDEYSMAIRDCCIANEYDLILSSSNKNSPLFETPCSCFEAVESQMPDDSYQLPDYSAYLDELDSDMGFYDSHCHLDFLLNRQEFAISYADFQRKHGGTFPRSYLGCIAVFCNPLSFERKPFWEKYLNEEKVWASFGCHPHHADQYDEIVDEALCLALKHPKVRALGEIGLDFSKRNMGKENIQRRVFRRQLDLALKRSLPIVIHCRDAYEECLKILQEVVPSQHHIHIHCFTADFNCAQKFLDSFPNLYIGITNLVTYDSAKSVHDVARHIPLNRLLLETDAPYFLPRLVPKEKRWSHPGMAVHVAAQIAALRKVHLKCILQATRQNTRRMYNL